VKNPRKTRTFLLGKHFRTPITIGLEAKFVVGQLSFQVLLALGLSIVLMAHYRA
jgi:hypothetical protein